MGIGAIDSSRIEAMIAQLKAAAATAQGGIEAQPIADQAPAAKVNFADALQAQLSQVNDSQAKADEMGKSFTLGDDKVSLSDVMISMQKANIAFQTTVQVRNKLVSAYHEIMNMQV